MTSPAPRHRAQQRANARAASAKNSAAAKQPAPEFDWDAAISRFRDTIEAKR